MVLQLKSHAECWKDQTLFHPRADGLTTRRSSLALRKTRSDDNAQYPQKCPRGLGVRVKESLSHRSTAENIRHCPVRMRRTNAPRCSNGRIHSSAECLSRMPQNSPPCRGEDERILSESPCFL